MPVGCLASVRLAKSKYRSGTPGYFCTRRFTIMGFNGDPLYHPFLIGSYSKNAPVVTLFTSARQQCANITIKMHNFISNKLCFQTFKIESSDLWLRLPCDALEETIKQKLIWMVESSSQNKSWLIKCVCVFY